MTAIRTRDGRPRRLSRRPRKTVLVVHIASAGAWIGIDVVLGVLVFTALLTDDPRKRAVCYQALQLFAIWPLLIVGLVCLLSGVTLGLGSKYGLVRYWWVAVKLGLNVLLTALVPLSLAPGVTELAKEGQRLAAVLPVELVVGDLIYPPIVSPLALLIAFTLSVFKPWGRIRKQPASRPRRATTDETVGSDPDAS